MSGMFPSDTDDRRAPVGPRGRRADVISRFRTAVKRVERCGEDVLVIALAKPRDYEFRAGQWFRMFLDTTEGEQVRTFSHASAPQEDELLIATRLSDSAFKLALERVVPGDEAEISAAGGRLALPADSDRVTFLTGGVGVTPVRSLLRASAEEGKHFGDALVLYGFREPSCAPFLEDLTSLDAAGVRVVPVCERPGPEWDGETGFIDAEMVQRHAGDSDGRPFVVTGPPAMVEAMEQVLDELGVARDRRIVERFGNAAPRE